GTGRRGPAVVAVADLAVPARVAAARRFLIDRRRRVSELAATLGAAAVPIPAGQPRPRTGMDRGPRRSAAPPAAAEVSALRGGLDRLGLRLPCDGRKALLPRRHVPCPLGRRSDADRRVVTAGVSPAASDLALEHGHSQRS